MNNLGTLYANGRGVDQDYGAAADWYQQAADAGSVMAMSNLGVCYEFGYGMNQDIAQALTWYQRAQELGYDASESIARAGQKLAENAE